MLISVSVLDFFFNFFKKIFLFCCCLCVRVLFVAFIGFVFCFVFKILNGVFQEEIGAASGRRDTGQQLKFLFS